MSKLYDKIKLPMLSVSQVILSFGATYLITKSIGFSKQLDIYYLCLGIYVFNLSILSNSIQAVVAPKVISDILPYSIETLRGKILTLVVLYSFICFLISCLFVFVFFNHDNSSKLLFLKLQLIFLIAFILKTINLVGISLLQKKKHYVPLNKSYVIASFVYLCIILMCTKFRFIYLEVFAISFLLRNVIEYVSVNYFCEVKYYSVVMRLVNPMDLLKDSKILIGGQLYYKSEDLLDKIITLLLSEGFLSLFAFIKSVFSAISNVIINSYVIQSLTYFSRNRDSFGANIKHYFNSKARFILGLYLVTLVSVALIGEFVFELLFSYKYENPIDVPLKLIMYAATTVVLVVPLNAVIQNGFIARAELKSLVKVDSIIYTVSILLKLGLTYWYGPMGFLLAFVIAGYYKIWRKRKVFVTRILKGNY